MKLLRPCHASTLIITMTALSSLSIIAAFTLVRITPTMHSAYQNAAWQEARIAAEAGVDAAIHDVIENTTGPAPSSWQGWKQQQDGIIGPVLAATFNLLNSLLSLSGQPTPTSDPIFLDNVHIAGQSNSEVDVQLWALRPAGKTRNWFRIRSMATVALPPVARQAPDQLDAVLRRFSLRSKRPRVSADDVGLPMTVPLPNVSRTVEVIVEPVPAFELAIWSAGSVTLPCTGTWVSDSYDSRDSEKSNNGLYPGATSPKLQANSVIATNLSRPATDPYGPLISAQGAQVLGVVATNGGDDPSTSTHENVANALQIDPSRVRDDFQREMRPVSRPPDTSATLLSLSNLLLSSPTTTNTHFTPGTESSPQLYHTTTTLGSFTVDAAPAGTRGAVVILIDGDLNVIKGSVVIAPNVTAKVFVRGNIYFHGNSINADASSSRMPGQLQIYGEDSGSTSLRQLSAQDNAMVCAAFYGPTYDITLDGSVTWTGAVAGRSFSIPHGGNGGFHYDEALSDVGPVVSYRIVSYVEDARE